MPSFMGIKRIQKKPFKKDSIRVSITDQGSGFQPAELANPLDPQNVMKESGRGIFILKSIMENVRFSFSPKGTTVVFKMKR